MADMDAEKLQRALDRAKIDLSESLERYREAVYHAAQSADGVPVICQIQPLWSELDGELQEITAQLIGGTIGAIQERWPIADSRREYGEKGVLLKNNGTSPREIIGAFGKVPYSRSVLYPADPESAGRLQQIAGVKSVYPLDEVLGLDVLPYRITCDMMCCVAREAVRAASYESAAEQIQQAYHVSISSTQVKSVAEYVGNCVLEEQTRLAAAAEQSGRRNPDKRRRRKRPDDVLYLEIGSGPVCLRDLPGKEVWGTCQGAVAFHSARVQLRPNRQGETVCRIMERDCIGYVGSPEAFRPHLLALAQRNAWDQCSEVVVRSDGSPWVRELAAQCLPGCRIMVDLHALREAVGKYAAAVAGEAEGESLAAEICGLVEAGRLEEALRRLGPYRKSRLPRGTPDAIAFLTENREAMDYTQYRAKGYLIDSVALEGGSVRTVLDRLNLHGSRWTTERARRMLALQARYVSEDWDSVCRLVRRKLYGEETPKQRLGGKPCDSHG